MIDRNNQSARALEFDQPNSSGSLRPQGALHPVAGEVVVRVAACALNFADLLALRNRYQEPTRWPHIPGMEFAGTVVDTGADVPGDLAGKPVVCFPGRGGLATFATCPIDRLIALEPNTNLADAAAIPIAYGTSHLALTQTVELSAGQTLVVLGAAGGVGLTAVEVGARLGARVIACAHGPDKCAVAAKAGAEVTLDTDTTPDLKKALREVGGVDVVYDAVGGDFGLAAFGALRAGGHFLIIGFASGTPPQLPLNHALVKNITLSGFYWGGLMALDPQAVQSSLRTVFEWYTAGDIAPHISQRFPLERAGEGLALLAQRGSTGKIVIEP